MIKSFIFYYVMDHETQQGVDVMPLYHVTIIDDNKEELTIEEDAEVAPSNFEEGNKALVDKIKEINLRSIENPRPIFLSMNLSQEEGHDYMQLMIEYKDVFTWSYKEMPGLDPKKGQIQSRNLKDTFDLS